jgi:lipid II:glycine glycyltransferase (peptidoglycan interpeptide bridge formation enzyme)
MTESKTKNIEYPINNVFQDAWYLDAVAPGSWGRVEVCSGDELLGWMPYTFIKQYPSSDVKMSKRLGQEKTVMTELISKLPKFDYFCQSFDYSVSNWLPFYWRGFKQTTRYTYILKDISEHEAILKGFAGKLRTQIKKAQKTLAVCDDMGVDALINLNRMTYERQNIPVPYADETLKRLVVEAIKRNAGKMLFAVDSAKNVHAAVFLVWDERSTYYLVGCTNTRFKGSDGASLLLWEAIKFASTVSKQFDFEGSMIEPIERHFRSFGAEQVAYHQITKTNSILLKTKEYVRSLIK